MLYPAPFGKSTFAAEKDYPVDYSHFNIMGTAVGAHGIEADSDKAVFSNVNVESEIGADQKIKLRIPVVVPGMGSTNVARDNWKDLAIGCAISGIALTVGENVCGMDPEVEIKNGRVIHSPAMEARVKPFHEWYDGYGEIIVQENVEDSRLGVLEYVIEKLGVETVELKWGQGAKNIGGEVKLPSIERAQQLKSRGYVVHPDPDNQDVQELFQKGAFKEFERHSRVGMVSEEGFMNRVKQLRDAGARRVFLKTGAYRPADLARAVKFSSDARIDLLTVDGAGGGTGMSPWRMMNEWGVPTVYIQSLLYQYLTRMKEQGRFVPSVAIAGGFAMEDHMFKALAMGAPYVKAVGMARTPLTAVMVGKTVGRMCSEGNLTADLKQYGESYEQIFTASHKLKDQYGKRSAEIPFGAVGLYSYMDRLTTGLQQLMCGARKFGTQYICRNDLVSLTQEGAQVTGLSYVMDADRDEVDRILSV
jgi:glutamate synthase domain-containing protein 2